MKTLALKVKRQWLQKEFICKRKLQFLNPLIKTEMHSHRKKQKHSIRLTISTSESPSSDPCAASAYFCISEALSFKDPSKFPVSFYPAMGSQGTQGC